MQNAKFKSYLTLFKTTYTNFRTQKKSLLELRSSPNLFEKTLGHVGRRTRYANKLS